MKQFLVLSIAMFVLVACGGGDSDTPATTTGTNPLANPSSLSLERPPLGSLPADLLPPG